ncbi:MAG: putative ABC transport system permease protein [Ancylomarina sp.]|jgi:putative ABC transport system permease protein
MFDLDKWQEITSALKKNKLRTALTGSGVMFGILILVTLLGLGMGFQNKMKSNLGNLATNSTIFWTERTTKPYKGLPRHRSFQFENSDLIAMKRSISGIENVAPEINAWSNGDPYNTFRKDKKGNFKIKGSSPEMNKVIPVEILSGRFINENDLKEMRKVITIGPRAVDLMFEDDEEPVGQYLKINGLFFKIIGTIKPLSRIMGMNDDIVQMPSTTLQKIYNRGEKFYAFMATAKVGESVEELEGDIISLLARRHKISPDDKEAFGHFNLAKLFNKLFGLFNSIGFLFWVIGFGVLITGIIGVSNIMHVVVKERTREIGVKRALGARPWEIISQIVTEAVFLTTFSGFWGLVIGVLLVEGAGKMAGDSNQMILNPYVDIKVAFIALGVLVVFGCFAGLLPAQKAMRIKPVDALRYE